MAKKPKIKNRLSELRAQGVVLSQEQVSKLLDIDATTVSRDETGFAMPRGRIMAYAALYKIPTHEIFLVAPREEATSEA